MVHPIQATSINYFQLDPFGMITYGRSWQTGSDYRYGFGGAETESDLNEEKVMYSTFYRMYDSRIGRWLSLDPKSSAFESPFVSFSNNPIAKVDPNGDSDYYTEKGVYIGSDGTDKTDIIVITNKDVVKAIQAQTKETLKNSDYAIATVTLNSGTFFILLPYVDRQKIKAAMKGFDEGAAKGMERGGRGLKLATGEHLCVKSEDGTAPTPTDHIAHINLAKMDKTDPSYNENYEKMSASYSVGEYFEEYTWHSHPDETWYSDDGKKTWMSEEDYYKKYPNGAPLDGPIIERFYTSEGASGADLEETPENPLAPDNYVLTPKFDKVYYYSPATPKSDKGGYDGTFPLDKFYDVQAKKAPKDQN